jgi:dihydroxy-acid dehydratase
MTDARFSGGSVGLVVGHVAPEAYLGGAIALIEDGDTITINIGTDRIDCLELDDEVTFEKRAATWKTAAAANGGMHPDARPVSHRVLKRMRATALPALRGGGMTDD